MKYKKGYKYQLVENYIVEINIYPKLDTRTRYISLSSTGVLQIKRGYAWDGPSGPTCDTRTFMRGSLVHDALYQLLRRKKLLSEYRQEADCILRKICIEDGMNRLRAWYVYKAVMIAGRSAASPKTIKKVHCV